MADAPRRGAVPVDERRDVGHEAPSGDAATSAAAPVWQPGGLAQCLFAPRSIALVGASGDPARPTARPQRFLRRHGFAGRVFAVNPSRAEVLGERTWPRVTDIDEAIDHAFVMVPAAKVEEALLDCAHKRVPVVTVFSDGFAESGAEGAAAQRRLAGLARTLGVRLLGPNCIGLVNAVDRVALTVNAALQGDTPQPGDVAVISQSGSMLGTLLSRGQARGLRFSRMISVGNETDLAVGELLGWLVDDRATRTVLLFLETLRDAPRFAGAARRARAAGKVVVAYKLGRSPLGSEIAASHTGALAGSDAAMDEFLRACGVVRVDMLETLIECPPLLARGPLAARAGPMRVAVVSTTGGGAALVVDRMGSLGLAPAIPGPDFIGRLQARGIDLRAAPVLDLTLAATAEKYSAVLRELLAADFCDAVLAVVGTSAQFQPSLAVEPIVAAARDATKPLAVFLAPQADESLALLAARGIAAFRTPEACADALSALARWSEPRAPAAPGSDTASHAAFAGLVAAAGGGRLDEDASLEVFARLGVPTVPRARLGPAPAQGDIESAGARLGWPVAAKLVSRGLAHKTEAGAVVLDLRDARRTAEAIDAMRKRVAASSPGFEIEAVMLQRMMRGLAEAIVGYREDPVVGPIVLLGAGGRLAEIHRDASVRLAPVDVAEARAMIDEVRSLAPIRGYRGLPRGDVDALAGAIVAVGRLALLPGRPVAEAEMNPILVRTDGVVAVDALMVLKQP